MISSKFYYRLLILFVALLGIAQMGWGLYLLTPRRPERRAEMKYLAFRHFSSPKFKYRFQVENERGLSWREVEIPEATGESILRLLRGSENSFVAIREFARQHPGALVTPSLPHSVGQMNVFEDGSDKPALTIDILLSQQVFISVPNRPSATFDLRPERLRELADLTAEIQWGPIPKDEP